MVSNRPMYNGNSCVMQSTMSKQAIKGSRVGVPETNCTLWPNFNWSQVLLPSWLLTSLKKFRFDNKLICDNYPRLAEVTSLKKFRFNKK